MRDQNFLRVGPVATRPSPSAPPTTSLARVVVVVPIMRRIAPLPLIIMSTLPTSPVPMSSRAGSVPIPPYKEDKEDKEESLGILIQQEAPRLLVLVRIRLLTPTI